MDWIKRNLYFAIGSAVALILMGLAGWFFYSKWSLNNGVMEKLNADYTELGRLNAQKPHPGSGPVDNIKAAREQQQQLRAFVQKARKAFQPIAPIPEVAKVTDRDFSGALSRTIEQLQREAANASVALPEKYSFSFEAQKQRVTFASGSLAPLSVQLGEVKAISEVLFQAKINSLESIRRERVSVDDFAGLQTDYVPDKSVTNELAVLTPYEVTFRCFSSELALVLGGFASSPHAMLIRTINVEPAAASAFSDVNAPAPGMIYAAPTPVLPMARPTGRSPESDMSAAMMRRYGMGRGEGREGGGRGEAGGGGPIPGGVPLRGFAPPPQPTAPPAYAPTPAAGGTPTALKGGLPTVLDEKQLKITMVVDVVKLLPVK